MEASHKTFFYLMEVRTRKINKKRNQEKENNQWTSAMIVYYITSLGWEDAMLRRKWKEFPIVEKPGPVQVVKCK